MKRITKKITVVLLAFVVSVCFSSMNTLDVYAAGHTTSKTHITTTVSTKTYKMSKPSNVSKITTSSKTKITTKVTENNSKRKVVEKKTVKTTTQTTLKKKSKLKTVKTTVKTTTVTTTTNKSPSNNHISHMTKKADKKLVNTFNNLDFKIILKKNLSTAGLFSADRQVIELKSYDTDVYLHEMGHFLSALKDRAGESSEFKKIYSAEKSKYKGNNKKYITSTSEEYFAESYRDYKVKPSTLKRERPKTYDFIKNSINSVSSKDTQRFKMQWGWAW